MAEKWQMNRDRSQSVNTACNLGKSDNDNHESKEQSFDKSFKVNGWRIAFARIALADHTDDNFFERIT